MRAAASIALPRDMLRAFVRSGRHPADEIEGVFLGASSRSRHYKVQWNTSPSVVVLEYACQHKLFRRRQQASADDGDAQPMNSLHPSPLSNIISNSRHGTRDGDGDGGDGGGDEDDEDEDDEDGGDDDGDSDDDNEGDINDAGTLVVGQGISTRCWRRDVTLDAIDPRSATSILPFPPRFSTPPSSSMPIDYFRAMFPPELASSIMRWTNDNVANPAVNKNKVQPVTAESFWRFIGIIYGFTTLPAGSINKYWRTEAAIICSPAHDFAKNLGMTQRRWWGIFSMLQFWAPAEANAQPDPWRRVRYLIEAFNDHYAVAFAPGHKITVDESMSRWLGYDHSIGSPPSKTKMKSKPEGVGFMIKTAADSASRVIIRLDLQETTDLMKKKEFFSPTVPLHTACTLRLVRPWRGTNRIVLGDSWFASVSTATELLRSGLYFVGLVKSNSSGFPKGWLQMHAFSDDSPRGAVQVLHSDIRLAEGATPQRMIALGWNEPKKRHGKSLKPKVFVATATSGAPETPWTRPRNVRTESGYEWTSIAVPQPQLVKEYFEAANAIDVANQYRQFSLNIETVWKTQNWPLRLFQTVLGVIMTNAFLAYRYFQGRSGSPLLTFEEFLGNIVNSLCRGDDSAAAEIATFLGKRRRRRSSASSFGEGNGDGDGNDDDDDANAGEGDGAGGDGEDDDNTQSGMPPARGDHRAIPVKGIPNGPAHGHCRLCPPSKKLACYYCPDCTKITDARKDYFFLCGPKSTRSCMFQHLEQSMKK
jgi:hypothetical protein